MKRLWGIAAAALAMTVAPAQSQAAWPQDKPIEMIVGFGAGGGTDIMARTMQPFLEKLLGAKILVINRPGASGEIAYTSIAEAKPDGYTIGFVNTPSLTSMQIERQVRFKLEDLQLIARMVSDPSAMTVRADGPIKSVKDLVEAAKAKPRAISMGTTGVGTDDHLSMILLEKIAGIQMTHVPYSGVGPMNAAMFGGHITVVGLNVGEVPQLGADKDKVRVIGQMGTERWAELPDVPTFREQGFDIVMSSERGLAAPRELPRDVLDRIAAAVQDMLKDPEFQAKAKQQSLPLAYLPGDKWGEKMKTDRKVLEEIWASSPWTKQTR